METGLTFFKYFGFSYIYRSMTLTKSTINVKLLKDYIYLLALCHKIDILLDQLVYYYIILIISPKYCFQSVISTSNK